MARGSRHTASTPDHTRHMALGSLLPAPGTPKTSAQDKDLASHKMHRGAWLPCAQAFCDCPALALGFPLLSTSSRLSACAHSLMALGSRHTASTSHPTRHTALGSRHTALGHMLMLALRYDHAPCQNPPPTKILTATPKLFHLFCFASALDLLLKWPRQPPNLL